MEKIQKPIVLSIAGFDISAGAGVLADIKTFEHTNVYGMSIVTALTTQSENIFASIKWRTIKVITYEIDFLIHQYPIHYAKIGIIKDAEMLEEIMYILRKRNISCVWDPVLKSSTSKHIFHTHTIPQLKTIFKQLYCITPNVQEAILLSGKQDIDAAGTYLSQYTNVIIKGGHNEVDTGTDYIYLKNQPSAIKIPPQTHFNTYPKHGSGCVYSSALTSYLSQGLTLTDAAIKAKIYTEHFLASNKSLLGFHQHIHHA